MPAGGSEGGRAAVSPLDTDSEGPYFTIIEGSWGLGAVSPLDTDSQDPYSRHTSASSGAIAACIVISGQKVISPNEKNGVYQMVGSGTECEPGFVARVARCPSCGHHVDIIPSGCGLVRCPRCSRRWARRAGERLAARVYGAFLAHVSHHKPRHVTFELAWREGEELDWKIVKARAAAIGCTGGALVVHPWRIREECESTWESLRDQKKTDEGRYAFVQRVFGAAGFEWRPHVHGLVYGRFEDIRKGSDAYAYRNIRKLGSLHMAEGVATYLFTHTFAPRGKENVFRYFGICSPQRLKPEWTGTIHEPMWCEKCGSFMLYEGSIEQVLHVHYIALGWHKVEKGPPTK